MAVRAEDRTFIVASQSHGVAGCRGPRQRGLDALRPTAVFPTPLDALTAPGRNAGPSDPAAFTEVRATLIPLSGSAEPTAAPAKRPAAGRHLLIAADRQTYRPRIHEQKNSKVSNR